jgi:hypothetical protein
MHTSHPSAPTLFGLIFIGFALTAAADAPVKESSSLYPPPVVQQVRKNVEAQPWAAAARSEIVKACQPWMSKTDDELWALMFGPGITRTWMVWSNGFCPACKQSVPMYNWAMDAMKEPWKVRCPHCRQAFPTNDFGAFYQSGLNERGVFDPARADRTLLFNADHPDPADPLRLYGVDDGEGFVEGENRWRFIGAYLIYGQWKQAVLGGIRLLSAAYLLTGEAAYAHKAGVLLDRTADLYPEFDFATQGLVYEKPGVAGYVSTWHDTCEETRELAMSYDMVFDGIRNDPSLYAFLSGKAAQHGLENPKTAFTDVQRNIEGRILRDAVEHRDKIRSNYPRTEVATAIMLAVLGWPENQAAFYEIVDPMLDRATAVDGVTGEKGLAGYSAFTVQAVTLFLAEFAKADPAFLAELYRKHPRLHDLCRFHIDTHCLGRYYPQSGDTGTFAMPDEHYLGMQFLQPGYAQGSASNWTLVPPASHTLLWRMYELTGDPALVQTAFHVSGRSPENLPRDIYAADGGEIRRGMVAALKREGMDVRLDSVNKPQWCLGILRSGAGKNARALWLDYDSGGGHGHHDGMNLGLFALGLDLMPEFGYPPVQFGGWDSPRARWYGMTAAHNTVVVDGQNTANGSGETTLWADGEYLRAIRAATPALNHGQRYERTAALVDAAADAFYVIDVFRVAGGREHVKFMHSHFGALNVTGVALQPAPDYGNGTQMRNFRVDPAPQPGWRADWTIEDRLGQLAPGVSANLRYTDFTTGAQAGLAEAWMVVGIYDSSEEVWIPRLMVRRQAPEGQTLDSTFVGVIEPYTAQPVLAEIQRLTLMGADGSPLSDAHVGLRLQLAGGGHDVLLLRDPAAPGETVIPGDPEVRTDADVCLVRFDAQSQVTRAALCNGTYIQCPGLDLKLPNATPFFEAAGRF